MSAKSTVAVSTTFYYSPVWSPDSKNIVYSDKRLNLWYVNADGGRACPD